VISNTSGALLVLHCLFLAPTIDTHAVDVWCVVHVNDEKVVKIYVLKMLK
jgi:hypothetical protein